MIAKSIAVIMTCHNRREKTIASVRALQAAAQSVKGLGYTLYLTDDGSTDGTGAAVRAIEPGAKVLQGSGNLFWNGGMHLAFGAALAASHHAYLWLNDDVQISEDAIARSIVLLDDLAKEDGAASILVGSTHDSAGRTSYGGVTRPRFWNPTKFQRVEPTPAPVRCEAFNGNFVFISHSAAERIGNIDPAFPHGMGDFDYGLRATAAGIPVWVMPGFVGLCDNDNRIEGSYRDPSLPFRERWRRMMSRKGLEPRGWAHFCRKHAGPAWPLYWAWPYARVVLSSLRRR